MPFLKFGSPGRRLLQNRHGSDWNITVILVSPYSVQELPLPNCMRQCLFETRKSKTIEKTPNSFTPLCYGFFLLTLNKLGSISCLAQKICQSNILDKDLFQVNIWEIEAIFMLCQFFLLPIWISHVTKCLLEEFNVLLWRFCVAKLQFEC